jgi:hypothetical protein
MLPDVLQAIFTVLAMLFRFVGLLAFGLGVGWFTLQAFKKDTWQLQIAVFLGFVGTAIAMTRFLSGHGGALGAFALGAGAALLFWGLPRKDDAEEKDVKKKK